MKVYDTVVSPVEGVPLLVPGGGFEPETGELNHRSMARVDVAIEAALRGFVPAVLLSGGATRGHKIPEAILMERYLRDNLAAADVPPLYVEDESQRTIQNFAYSMPFLDELGLLGHKAELSLVSDRAHLPRLLSIAEIVLPRSLSILPIASSYKPTAYDRAREMLARPVTKMTMLGLPAGAGPEKALTRERLYGQIKGGVKRVLHHA